LFDYQNYDRKTQKSNFSASKSQLVQKILSCCHTGFSVHSQVRAKDKEEAVRVGKYMIRPLLSLQRLSFNEGTGKVSYVYGKDLAHENRMGYLEFIARVTSHIPDKEQVT